MCVCVVCVVCVECVCVYVFLCVCCLYLCVCVCVFQKYRGNGGGRLLLFGVYKADTHHCELAQCQLDLQKTGLLPIGFSARQTAKDTTG